MVFQYIHYFAMFLWQKLMEEKASITQENQNESLVARSQFKYMFQHVFCSSKTMLSVAKYLSNTFFECIWKSVHIHILRSKYILKQAIGLAPVAITYSMSCTSRIRALAKNHESHIWYFHSTFQAQYHHRSLNEMIQKQWQFKRKEYLYFVCSKHRTG